MATGYTNCIKDGISFKDFALNCSRAFGALYSLRDMPYAEIPDSIKPSSYHKESIEEAKKEYEKFLNMDSTDIINGWNEYCKNSISSYMNIKNKAIKLKNSYEKMLEQVKAWQPPTDDHTNLKEFMINQIEKSIDFDCSGRDEPMEKLLTIDEWYGMMIKDSKKDIEYHTKQWEKEVERCDIETKWIQDLKRSL